MEYKTDLGKLRHSCSHGMAITAIFIFCFGNSSCGASQEATKSRIHADIEKANYCMANEDCMIPVLGCPFDCGPYINKKEEAALKNEVNKYITLYGSCMWDCVRPVDPACVAGKCVPAVCEPDKPNKAFQCECPAGTKRSGYLNTDFTCVTTKGN